MGKILIYSNDENFAVQIDVLDWTKLSFLFGVLKKGTTVVFEEGVLNTGNAVVVTIV